MRKIIVRLVLWLCNRFDITPLDESRIFMGEDAKARSQRWESFAREPGGLFDMIEALRREAFEAMAETAPEDVDKLQYLAMSDRNLRRLDRRVRSIINEGKIQERNEARKPVQILKSV